MSDGKQIVGNKTFSDGRGGFRHEPLTRDEADTIWTKAKALYDKRAADMPTERDALNALSQAYKRLTELGWKNAIYCPKDGSIFKVIEAGSSGIHDCSYWGEWPTGSWMIHAEGDLCPSHPILFKPSPNDTKGKTDARQY
ncbi:MAG: hypothetical protein RIB80_04840 [Rhodospirillales bacterium]